MDIAERVSIARRVIGLTVQELALMAEVPLSMVTRVESGTMRPSAELAVNLLSVLGLSVDARSVADRGALAAAQTALDRPAGSRGLFELMCGSRGGSELAWLPQTETSQTASASIRPERRQQPRAYTGDRGWWIFR